MCGVPQILSMRILQQLFAECNRCLLQKCGGKRRAGVCFPGAARESVQIPSCKSVRVQIKEPAAIFLRASCVYQLLSGVSVDPFLAVSGGIKQLEAQMLLCVFENRPCFEYAMPMDIAAAREASAAPAPFAAALQIPGPKHFSSAKIRMVRTGLNSLCAHAVILTRRKRFVNAEPRRGDSGAGDSGNRYFTRRTRLCGSVHMPSPG